MVKISIKHQILATFNIKKFNSDSLYAFKEDHLEIHVLYFAYCWNYSFDLYICGVGREVYTYNYTVKPALVTTSIKQ